MIAVDTNILVYAHFEEFPLHSKARKRLIDLAQGNDRWGIPIFCLGEFLRIVTHPRLFGNPYPPDLASEAVSRLLESPSLHVLMPGERFLPFFLEIVGGLEVKGNLVYDAMVLALCREAGARALLTEDRDFDRFQGIEIVRL